MKVLLLGARLSRSGVADIDRYCAGTCGSHAGSGYGMADQCVADAVVAFLRKQEEDDGFRHSRFLKRLNPF